MPDAFISYSVSDENFAQFLHRHLTSEGLHTYLASVSLRPGEKWQDAILAALKSSSWVLFLGSKKACESAYVQQELGFALASEKKIIPIVWDQDPAALPGWMKRLQAINLAGASPEQVGQTVSSIAGRIKADKIQGQIIAGLLIAGFLYAVARG